MANLALQYNQLTLKRTFKKKKWMKEASSEKEVFFEC